MTISPPLRVAALVGALVLTGLAAVVFLVGRGALADDASPTTAAPTTKTAHRASGRLRIEAESREAEAGTSGERLSASHRSRASLQPRRRRQRRACPARRSMQSCDARRERPRRPLVLGSFP